MPRQGRTPASCLPLCELCLTCWSLSLHQLTLLLSSTLLVTPSGDALKLQHKQCTSSQQLIPVRMSGIGISQPAAHAGMLLIPGMFLLCIPCEDHCLCPPFQLMPFIDLQCGRTCFSAYICLASTVSAAHALS